MEDENNQAPDSSLVDKKHDLIEESGMVEDDTGAVEQVNGAVEKDDNPGEVVDDDDDDIEELGEDVGPEEVVEHQGVIVQAPMVLLDESEQDSSPPPSTSRMEPVLVDLVDSDSDQDEKPTNGYKDEWTGRVMGSDDDSSDYSDHEIAEHGERAWKWDEHCVNGEVDFQIYQANPEFRDFAKPYLKVINRYAAIYVYGLSPEEQKHPKVDKFWEYVIEQELPRFDWKGEWKVVNTERRGWPLQYATKAEVLIKPRYTTRDIHKFYESNDPKLENFFDLEVIKITDPEYTYAVSNNNADFGVWLLEPIIDGDATSDSHRSKLEATKEVLKLIRTCKELIQIGKSRSVITNLNIFFREPLLRGLKLLFYLERPSPRDLLLEDRSRVIEVFKKYFNVKQKIMLLENGGAHDEANQDTYVVLQMQLRRVELDLKELLDDDLRVYFKLRDLKPKDASYHGYENILVLKETNIQDLGEIQKRIADFNSTSVLERVRFSTDLDEVLRNCDPGTKVFVVSGNYSISGLHQLGQGGALIGIPIDEKDIKVTPTEIVGDIWLFYGDTEKTDSALTIKNINFVVDSTLDTVVETGFFACRGTAYFENTKITDISNVTPSDFVPAKKSSSEDVHVQITNCNFIMQ